MFFLYRICHNFFSPTLETFFSMWICQKIFFEFFSRHNFSRNLLLSPNTPKSFAPLPWLFSVHTVNKSNSAVNNVLKSHTIILNSVQVEISMKFHNSVLGTSQAWKELEELAKDSETKIILLVARIFANLIYEINSKKIHVKHKGEKIELSGIIFTPLVLPTLGNIFLLWICHFGKKKNCDKFTLKKMFEKIQTNSHWKYFHFGGQKKIVTNSH